MDFELACSTWIREEDERVLEILKASPRWLTPEELQAQTGLPLARIESTLRQLKQQIRMQESRKRFLSDLNPEK